MDEVVPSFLSTATCIRSGTHERPLDLARFAEDCLQIVDVAYTRAMDSDVVRRGDRILHLPYTRLVENPVAAATEVCERFGLPLDSGVAEAMRGWLGRNGQHRFGRHRYQLEPFGLDPAHVRERYAKYASWLEETLDNGAGR
jgi:hypothetical protein